MATNTTNFKFKKPDESDFYDIQDQNGNWEIADEALQNLTTPTFEDYTGESATVPSAANALAALKSKIKLPTFMSNVVAFCKGCCTLAMIVNNCVSSDTDKPLSAAQGKVLMELITQLNSDLTGNSIVKNSLPEPHSIAFGWDNNRTDWLFYATIDSTNFGIPHVGQSSYTGNLNNMRSGIYFCSTTATNLPDGINGICLSLVINSDTAAQLFISSTNKLYTRFKASGAWSSWVEK